MLIPAYLISVVTGLAGLSWLLYASSQKGRYQASVLPWLSLPFFVLCAVYIWFTFFDISIEIRATYARYGIMSIALPQAIVLIVLSLYHGGKHGKP